MMYKASKEEDRVLENARKFNKLQGMSDPSCSKGLTFQEEPSVTFIQGGDPFHSTHNLHHQRQVLYAEEPEKEAMAIPSGMKHFDQVR